MMKEFTENDHSILGQEWRNLPCPAVEEDHLKPSKCPSIWLDLV